MGVGGGGGVLTVGRCFLYIIIVRAFKLCHIN